VVEVAFACEAIKPYHKDGVGRCKISEWERLSWQCIKLSSTANAFPQQFKDSSQRSLSPRSHDVCYFLGFYATGNMQKQLDPGMHHITYFVGPTWKQHTDLEAASKGLTLRL